MKNGSLSQKEQIFCSFLNVFLERTSLVLFPVPNASEKDNKNFPFEYMKNGSHHKKSNYVVPFWTSFVLFALPNASEKDKKIVPFEYMKNGSHHKKSNYFVPFWTSPF